MSFEQLDQHVIVQGLCVRCGLCVGVCPVLALGFNDDGYPQLIGKCTGCEFCNSCCPGGDVDFPALSRRVYGVDYDPLSLQGYVENMYVAYPGDSAVREAGASGGLVTGLLLYLLAKKKIDGAVVAGMDPEKPYCTKGVLATTAEEIIAAARSKYSVTPSMDVLQFLRRSKGRFAVVGLPCQIQGLRKLEKVDPGLSAKIYCLFGLYCHCNLERNAPKEAIEVKGIDLADVARFDFRGGAWPGRFQVTKKDGAVISLYSINPTTVLNVLFRLYGAKRCFLCVDALAEYADLSFGDFWAHDYTGTLAEMERCTLVSQRTQTGASLLQEAVADGAIILQRLPEERASKRILNMARGKKQKAWAQLISRAGDNEAIPRYHFDIPEPSSKAKRSLFMFFFYSLLRGIRLRKFILKIFFSPVGGVIDYLNLRRKRWFCNYHGN
jgi:coenzyme F420 hydrogenase subunit beta